MSASGLKVRCGHYGCLWLGVAAEVRGHEESCTMKTVQQPQRQGERATDSSGCGSQVHAGVGRPCDSAEEFEGGSTEFPDGMDSHSSTQRGDCLDDPTTPEDLSLCDLVGIPKRHSNATHIIDDSLTTPNATCVGGQRIKIDTGCCAEESGQYEQSQSTNSVNCPTQHPDASPRRLPTWSDSREPAQGHKLCWCLQKQADPNGARYKASYLPFVSSWDTRMFTLDFQEWVLTYSVPLSNALLVPA